MHTCGIARNQWVPSREIPLFCNQSVRAGPRQPSEAVHPCRGKAQAVGHALMTPFVIFTATAVWIQQATGDIGVKHLIGVLVLHFVQTTASTAVAQRLPFTMGHIAQGLCFPERTLHLQPPRFFAEDSQMSLRAARLY